MGFVRDIKARLSKARNFLLRAVELARRAIYTLGNGIGSSMVEDLLKETSSVPTLVRFLLLFISVIPIKCLRRMPS
jgi:hypothetical protein